MKIKTRESLKTIKTFDRAENLAGKTKSSFSDLNKGAEETQGMGYTSGTEYAGTHLQESEEKGIRNTLYGANRAGRWGVKETGRNIRRWKTRRKKPIHSKQKALPAPKRQMLSAPKTADKTALAMTKAEKAAQRAQKTAKATLKASGKAAQAAKEAAKASVHGIKVAVKATVAAVKATVAAVKGIIAAIAAGGWIAVVVIVLICAVALVAGSVYAIFVPVKESGVTMTQTIYELEAEYREKQEAIKSQYTYDICEYRGELADIKEVIAVYAVKLNLDKYSPQEIATFDEQKEEQLKTIFWDMNMLNVFVETRTQVNTKVEIGDDGELAQIQEEVQLNCLVIETVPKSISDMAESYHFSEQQVSAVYELIEWMVSENCKGLTSLSKGSGISPDFLCTVGSVKNFL